MLSYSLVISPPDGAYFVQLHEGPHWQEEPHWQVWAGAAHLHAGAQVQGLQLHWLVMINSSCSVVVTM
jgi:hypothetical protein